MRIMMGRMDEEEDVDLEGEEEDVDVEGEEEDGYYDDSQAAAEDTTSVVSQGNLLVGVAKC
jgi:hypothetical protein